MPPLTAAQILQHPEYPHVIWDLPRREGVARVAQNRRGGPINISYELHGHGPRKILFIMGLGGLRSSWQRQSKDFGQTRGEEYTVLVLDNRGIGGSDKPYRRYSTTEMARDTVELLDHVGWTEERSVNIVGVSLGGMIAQEMALQIPTHISTLTLLSTAALLVNTTSFLANARQRLSMFLPKSLDATIANAKAMIYTDAYLASPDTLECTSGTPFPTSGDRFAAGEIAKRQTPGAFSTVGFINQAVAAGWHCKTREQLGRLADGVGRERIMVVHGDCDRMIGVSHAEALHEGLSGGGSGVEVRKVIWGGQGHVVPIEKREEFRELLAGFVNEFFDERKR